jgi:hypothetical protein
MATFTEHYGHRFLSGFGARPNSARLSVTPATGGLLRTTNACAQPQSFNRYYCWADTHARLTMPEEFADAVLFFLSWWLRAVLPAKI